MSEEFAAVLEKFGFHVRNFAFDKAKETADEFRATKYSTSAFGGASFHQSVEQSSWQILVQCLPQLALAEKSYMSLSFLLPKGFLRKESPLRANYAAVRAEFAKIGENLACDVTEMDPPRQTVVGHLAAQLKRFVDARTDLMTLYERLSMLGAYSGNVKPACYDETYVDCIDEMNQRYNGAFTHPLISGIVANLTSELEIISNLLKCHSKLGLLTFMDSLFHLTNAQAALKLLSRTSASSNDTEAVQGTHWFGFSGSSKSPVLPPLFLWHKRYYDSLLSKFSLYFHDLFIKQTTPQEMKAQMSKVPENYLHRIAAFHRKQDATYVCLILNAEGSTHCHWQGYHHPDYKTEPLKGLESYPVVLSYPVSQERPPNLLPSAVMIINEQNAKLSSLDGTAMVYDASKDVSFFVCRVEAQLYLLITFKGRKNERDSNIATFMHEICADLRCVKVFAVLKAAAK